MNKQKFRTVEEYYHWGSQANMLAPEYKDLHPTAKESWLKMFSEWKLNRAQEQSC